MTKKPVGWRGESERHSLAARGIKTPSNPRSITVDLTGNGIETTETERTGEGMVTVTRKLEPTEKEIEEKIDNAENLLGAVMRGPEIRPILARAKKRLQHPERMARAKKGIEDDYDFLMEELAFSLLDVALEMDVAVDGMVSPSDYKDGVKEAKVIIENIKKANDWSF